MANRSGQTKSGLKSVVILLCGILLLVSLIVPFLGPAPGRSGVSAMGPNPPQAMILNEWSAEKIEEQIAWFRTSLDFDTGGYPPALALAASRDRWDAVDIFLDYGADYSVGCAALEQAGETALAARLLEYSQQRRETHAIIEVDPEELLRKNKDKPIVIPAPF